MTHTPGPWELVDASMQQDRDGFIATDTDKTIEIRPAVGAKLGDEKADFSLIAAAPELLAALVDFVAVAEKELAGLKAIQAELSYAKKAISKATGGTQ